MIDEECIDTDISNFYRFITIAFCVCFFLLGCKIGSRLTESNFRQQALEQGYAKLNSITGKWEWKDELED